MRRIALQNFTIALIVSAAMALTACAGDAHRRAKLGALAGAVGGALIGSQLGDKSGTNVAIGAAIGGALGGGVGNYMDNEHAALQKKLAAEQARKELYITRMGGNTLRVGVASDASFAVDSAKLSLNAQTIFQKIGHVLDNYQKTAILVVGSTDNTGSADYNMKLSKQRAQAVASFLVSQGVNAARVRTYGLGETQPIASNDTKQGRARNRRVDIILRPIVKGNTQAAFAPPPYLGS